MTDDEGDEMTEPAQTAAPDEPAETETETDDATPAEVVHLPDRVERGADAAIEAAANAALAEPGVPGRDEFLAMASMARVLSMSDLAPKDLRGKPANAFLLLLTARSLNIDATAALRKVNIIEGQPSIAPQLLAALIRRQGLGRIQPGELRPDRAEAVPLGPHGERLGPTVAFTWQDAQRVKKRDGVSPALVDERCAGPDEHVARCRCKDNWRNYPAQMLWWRAVGKCADMYYPEVGLGLYSADELGAVTDDTGEPIDPATADLPHGYETRAGSGSRVEPVDPADVAWLERVLIGLGETPLRGQLKAKWAEAIGPVPPDGLDAGGVRMAKALVRGMVKASTTETGESADEIAARVEATESDESAGTATESGEEPPPDPEPGGPTEPQPSPAPPVAPESDAGPSSGPGAPGGVQSAGDDDRATDPGDEVDADLPDEVVEPAMVWAGRLNGPQVDRELRRYGLGVGGRLAERQSRLATHVIALWAPLWVAHDAGEHGDPCGLTGCPVSDPPF